MAVRNNPGKLLPPGVNTSVRHHARSLSSLGSVQTQWFPARQTAPSTVHANRRTQAALVIAITFPPYYVTDTKMTALARQWSAVSDRLPWNPGPQQTIQRVFTSASSPGFKYVTTGCRKLGDNLPFCWSRMRPCRRSGKAAAYCRRISTAGNVAGARRCAVR